ncbi:Crp/Fnr family transcriptional regulator [Hasllibacter sp. MH4015]|uniref:Crp/Fnr family transcriptional regulator n=1 Tax=Hasllibacter sp. MH4015 TaxID=2854029 RepID=UPI001CD2A820|nr:cyclic nucleotide-binding domain-containing protein [Hasllibacter sp. MH4015]
MAFLFNGALAILVLAMLMRSFLWLRALVIVAAVFFLVLATMVLGDGMLSFWALMLIAVNLLQLYRTEWSNFLAPFNAEEQAMVSEHLPGLNRDEARRLLDQGQWLKLPNGQPLSAEGQPVDHLYYIAKGHADVEVVDDVVSVCREGNFVGEMTVMTGAPASATVTIGSPTAQLWRIEAGKLRALLEGQDAIARALDAAFARNYRDKLGRMNRRALED